jgi:hypothetical protein
MALQISLFLFPLYIFVYDGFELHWMTLVLKTETHKKGNEKQNEPRTSEHVVENKVLRHCVPLTS